MYALTIWGAGAKPPSPLHPECEHSVLLFVELLYVVLLISSLSYSLKLSFHYC